MLVVDLASPLCKTSGEILPNHKINQEEFPQRLPTQISQLTNRRYYRINRNKIEFLYLSLSRSIRLLFSFCLQNENMESDLPGCVGLLL